MLRDIVLLRAAGSLVLKLLSMYVFLPVFCILCLLTLAGVHRCFPFIFTSGVIRYECCLYSVAWALFIS
ncbi:hypothetical protein P170DRAFT_397356 [Aspergillus steynii IBT 23096]|uniref:Uncharacterized protein n=1 Tax=Aspergillus steynii IBT 23096 TaxID=1392250 RepID=A0A2I2GMT9_9EURO|nr:uncharacterized protein P170DRAFT_397356 [Aspergillus steynii IBT 23096]PLB54211.1 hypothetical protein P170DRAFT_397356 [Aspergillus steynii IBT 23096]